MAKTLQVLQDRLTNEITRETALECFALLTESPLGIDLESVVNKVVEQTASFLKKSKSSLRVTAANAVTALGCKSGAVNKVSEKLLLTLIKQTADYVNVTEVVRQAPLIDKKGQLLKAITQHILARCYAFLLSRAGTTNLRRRTALRCTS